MPSKEELPKWEEVAKDPWTLRLEVPGGWIYNVVDLTDNGQQYTNSAVFVPFHPRYPSEK